MRGHGHASQVTTTQAVASCGCRWYFEFRPMVPGNSRSKTDTSTHSTHHPTRQSPRTGCGRSTSVRRAAARRRSRSCWAVRSLGTRTHPLRFFAFMWAVNWVMTFWARSFQGCEASQFTFIGSLIIAKYGEAPRGAEQKAHNDGVSLCFESFCL